MIRNNEKSGGARWVPAIEPTDFFFAFVVVEWSKMQASGSGEFAVSRCDAENLDQL